MSVVEVGRERGMEGEEGGREGGMKGEGRGKKGNWGEGNGKEGVRKGEMDRRGGRDGRRGRDGREGRRKKRWLEGEGGGVKHGGCHQILKKYELT